ncbi:hypothetical protein BK126_21455 [Paenibacillus sp. FSL H7-0326]|uniref:YfhO family protein n=1 Tax=Paenibacillus sp. FSL H7-0326 TaxID=1921144 RepID=UPI0009700749|nr:YfhO family protein [Paenibacillus sp. FSL H7-0326]OMC66565.1 hypothetical protein BK126_21455 [Paenibacillus sp. FSL H7-0326]
MTNKIWFYPTLIVLLVLVFFLQIILGTAFFGWDILDYHFPYLYQTINGYRDFDYLWSPYILSGYPVYADPQGAISYPFNFLLSFIKDDPGYIIIEMQVIFHFMLAGLFTYFYAKKIGFSNHVSFISSIVFIFGGFMATHTQHYGTIDAIAWVPLMLLLLEYSFEKKNRYFYLILTGLIYGMSVLAGHIQTSLNTAYLLIFYLMWRNFFGKSINKNTVFTFLKSVFLMFFIGGLIAIVQILPTLQLMSDSPRSEMSLDGSMAANLVPIHIISLILPYFFGKYGYTPSWLNREIVESHLYIGLIPLVLVIVGFILASRYKESNSRHSAVTFWFVFTIIYLLMAFGGETILHYINYYIIPGYNKLRRSYNFYSFTTFGFSIIVAYTLTFARVNFKVFYLLFKKINKILLMFLSLLVIVLYGVLLLSNSESIEIVKPIINNAIISIVIISLGVLISTALYHKKIKGAHFSTLLIILILFDVFSFNANQIFNAQKLNVKSVITQSALYGENLEFVPEIEQRIENNTSTDAEKVMFLGFPATIQNQSILFGFENIYSYNPMRINSYDKYLQQVFPLKDESGLGSDVKFNSTMFNLLGVKYIVATSDYVETNSVELKEPNFTLIGSYNGGNYILFENNEVSPESFISYSISRMPEDKVLPYMSSDEFLGEEIVFDDQVENKTINQSQYKNEPVKVNQTGNGNFSISVDMKDTGALFVNKTYYDGWKAFIEGKEYPVEKVNGTFIGMEIGEGKYTIDFVFKPKIYYISAFVSGVTAIIVIIYIITTVFNRNRRYGLVQDKE